MNTKILNLENRALCKRVCSLELSRNKTVIFPETTSSVNTKFASVGLDLQKIRPSETCGSGLCDSLAALLALCYLKYTRFRASHLELL